MPIYDCRLNDTGFPVLDRQQREYVGLPAEPFPRFDGKPGRLVDATGRVIDVLFQRCNTDTGEVWHLARGVDGKYEIESDGRAKVACTVYPSPLSYVFREDTPCVAS